jgi:hypothetical protein
MNLKIPTDEALGLQIKRIVAAVALVAVAFYVAGYVLGTAVHWLSANLTRLPAALSITIPSSHVATHPLVRHSHSHDRPGPVRPRQPRAQSSRSGVGFA